MPRYCVKRNRRTPLLERSGMILHGLNSCSIREMPVEIVLDGKVAGRFHALELYQQVVGTHCHPQTIADLVCNSYLRLTCRNPNGTSATFGSSLVGAPSFRDLNGNLNFIPGVAFASVYTEDTDTLSITLAGSYGGSADFTSVRSYRTGCNNLDTCTELEIRMKITEDIELDRAQAGRDRFRICTLSSMYAGPDRYDGNLLQFENGGFFRAINLKDAGRVAGYLLSELPRSPLIRLIKEPGSCGRKNTPGSRDSPGLECRVVDSNIPLSEIGVQGYLTDTTDVNEDSLSLWFEWVDCPDILRKGQEIWAKMEISALRVSGHDRLYSAGRQVETLIQCR